jgi:hypothetical protein
MREGF